MDWLSPAAGQQGEKMEVKSADSSVARTHASVYD
jgi:hypothetical protein